VTAVARVTMLHLRTVAPYRTQGLLVFAAIVLIDSRSLVGLIPALALLLAPLVAAQPFMVADKADLQTLYAVLPLSRRMVPRTASAALPGSDRRTACPGPARGERPGPYPCSRSVPLRRRPRPRGVRPTLWAQPTAQAGLAASVEGLQRLREGTLQPR